MPELREALEAALAQQNEEEKGEPTETEVQASGEVTDDTGTGERNEDRETDTPSEPAAESTETKADSPKFLPAEEEQAKEETTEPVEPVSTVEVEPGPVAWRAAAKQHWGELPAEVRQEVVRREKEMNQGLRESADARRFQGDFEQAVEPYRPLMQAAGVSPLKATQNLWQMAAILQNGNVQQKAQIVAKIIQQNRVDIEALDGLLSGQGGTQSSVNVDSGVSEIIQRELAPVREFMGNIQQARQTREQQTYQDAQTEMEAFAADPANVFFEDVREDMADIVELAARRGENLTYKQAYDRAIAMRQDLAEVVQQVETRRATAQTAGDLARKKRAASSVQGVPVQPSNAKPVDMRGQLAEAWDAHSGDRH